MIRNHNIYYILVPFLFSFIAVFTFLSFNNPRNISAVSTDNFDPGYIISDYQMGNYESMTVEEIQTFLVNHGNCHDTGIWKASDGTNLPEYFSIRDGHFVCLADEIFGEGVEYGATVENGKSAAQIIYDVAHEYRINPQTLIVLLEKEQGLISDSWPNKFQYRIATGYGCPDNGEGCDSKYYGFENQLSWAASLFRKVLDGSWTNFPLGDNYIQYNPNPDCGGSVVNVKNYATSALYRYTPYQPNTATLAAGYGSGIPCGAYGNRNFYLLFNDWFGDSKKENDYVNLDNPRELLIKKSDFIQENSIEYFTSKKTVEGQLCLRTQNDTNNGIDRCVLWSDLEELQKYTSFDNPRSLIARNGAIRINPYTKKQYDTIEKKSIIKYVSKIKIDGIWYYRSEYSNNNNIHAVVSSIDVDELPVFTSFDAPRYMRVSAGTKYMNAITEEEGIVEKTTDYYFTKKIFINNQWYYGEYVEGNNQYVVIPANEVEEIKYEPFVTPRSMILSEDVDRIDPILNKKYDSLALGMILRYTSKIKVNEVWYYRTEYMTNLGASAAIPASAIEELNE